MEHLSSIQTFTVWVLPVLFAITVHEVAHGWIANKLGDKTALIMGRLTLNPLKHIDLVGTILIPAILLMLGGFVFGWAKPVPVNFANLRHPRRDSVFVALAGPVANLLMVIGWALIGKFGSVLLQHGLFWALAIVYMGHAGILINLVLMILNLVPIPPLDGGRVMAGLLPRKIALKYIRIEPFGFLILLLLLSTGILGYVLGPLVFGLFRIISALLGI